VVGIAALTAFALCAVGLVLASHRDLGSAFAPARRGRAHAGAWVRTGWSMAWRLDRAALLAWVIGAAAFGVEIGILVRSAVKLVQNSPQLAQAITRLGGTPVVADAYVLVLATVLALAAAGFGVSTILRLHADETTGRGELVLSTRTSRAVWAGGRVVTAGLGSLLILVVGGVCIGASYGLSVNDVIGKAARYGTACLIAVPATWVLIAFTVAVIGLLPRAAWLGWAALIWTGVVAELGAVLGLPAWIQRTTPFWYTPAWPAQGFEVLPIIGLLVVVVILVVTGLVGFRRRDFPA
jgi:ABC-2 type transport system permease protein